MTCSVQDCHNQSSKRGMCNAHYLRWWKYGSATGGSTSKNAAQDFLQSVLVYDGDDCLKWPYAKVNGYGQIRVNGELKLVPRIACEAANGPPPTPKHEAAHSCGNGHLGCSTKRHLRWATRAENRQDMIDYGRSQRGTKSHFASLSEAQVTKIRSLLQTNSQRSVAKQFGVTQSAIQAIASGKSWAWMEA